MLREIHPRTSHMHSFWQFAKLIANLKIFFFGVRPDFESLCVDNGGERLKVSRQFKKLLKKLHLEFSEITMVCHASLANHYRVEKLCQTFHLIHAWFHGNFCKQALNWTVVTSLSVFVNEIPPVLWSAQGHKEIFALSNECGTSSDWPKMKLHTFSQLYQHGMFFSGKPGLNFCHDWHGQRNRPNPEISLSGIMPFAVMVSLDTWQLVSSQRHLVIETHGHQSFHGPSRYRQWNTW